MSHLIWFRNDLRTLDQPTLHAAIQNSLIDQTKVIACYIDCPKQWKIHHMSEKRYQFLLSRVYQIKKDLAQLNITLIILRVDSFLEVPARLKKLCNDYHVSNIYYNSEWEPYEQNRDIEVIDLLDHVKINKFHSDCLVKPNTLFTGQNTSFKVFTPFKKKWLANLSDIDILNKPIPLNKNNQIKIHEDFELSKFEQGLDSYPVDDSSILARLRTFVSQSVDNYQITRDFPNLEGTSRLSSYLAIGALSPKQCLMRLFYQYPTLFSQTNSGPMVWLSELIWREFYKHTLVSFSKVGKHKAFLNHFEYLDFDDNDYLFTSWCKGQTGYPIVDAAMRQLNQTGWMHNRLRMITASFLIKDLHVDWRWGEKYFMQNLIDGDLAANNGGWQWAASTGTDAAPYFRIFNPTTQSQRFDKDGSFIKRFIPELAHVPSRYIHKPHDYAVKFTQTLNYPKPIIDHKEARLKTLELYKQAKLNYISQKK